jgi:hypothetical protein
MCTPVIALVIESVWVSAKPILLHKICCYWGVDLKETSKRPQEDLLALALALVLALASALSLALSLT